MPGWGTRRDAAPDPGMVDLLRRLYAEGYSIQISCGGWNPATTPQDFSDQRSAWQRRYLAQWGIPYDRLVAKDDVTTWGDDKVLHFESAKQIEPLLMAKLGPAVPWGANSPINEPDAPIKGWYLGSPGIKQVDLEAALESHKAAVLGEVQKLLGQQQQPQPVNVTVNFPEGMIPVNLENHSHIDPGAVAITQLPAGQMSEFEYDTEGRITRVSRQ